MRAGVLARQTGCHARQRDPGLLAGVDQFAGRAAPPGPPAGRSIRPSPAASWSSWVKITSERRPATGSRSISAMPGTLSTKKPFSTFCRSPL